MAKNDYFVIMYRILTYMYECLKEGVDVNKELISYESLGVSEKYWTAVVINMVEKGYIKGITVFPILGNRKGLKWIDPEITQEGVEFLQTNSTMAKAKDFLKTLKEIVPGL